MPDHAPEPTLSKATRRGRCAGNKTYANQLKAANLLSKVFAEQPQYPDSERRDRWHSDYSQPPVPPLHNDDAAWARQLLSMAR